MTERHPKIIVGSRKLWEAMGKIVSEAEIDEATLAALTAYDNYTRLPEDVMGYGPMRAALTAALPHLQNEIERLRAGNADLVKTVEVLQERYAGRRNDALEEAVLVAEDTGKKAIIEGYGMIVFAIRSLKEKQEENR